MFAVLHDDSLRPRSVNRYFHRARFRIAKSFFSFCLSFVVLQVLLRRFADAGVPRVNEITHVRPIL